MDEKILEERIQKIINYMIPQAWKNVKVFALAKGGNSNNVGELYFYYMPQDILNRNYINCYEIPENYNIDDEEFNNLIKKLYNYILILREYHIKAYNNNWNMITITLDKRIFKLETNSMPVGQIPFSSYELQVIWRYVNLKIEPSSKQEKEIITRYINSDFAQSQKATKVSNAINFTGNSIVDYDKVLTIDEILARRREEEKEKENRILNEQEEMNTGINIGTISKVINTITEFNNKIRRTNENLF